jgi:lipopolysaccharide cholinephosphotransferase
MTNSVGGRPGESPRPDPDEYWVMLRQLQLTELEIFREIKRICDLSSVRYYMLGGSVLGAVRHKGFIPWDDDIDVAMPRPDYERFASICATQLDGRFWWQSYRTEDRYPLVFGKLLHCGTELLQQPTQHLPIRHSVYVDVFPLDGIPQSRLTRLGHKHVLKFCEMRISADVRRRGYKRLAASLTRVIPRGLAIKLFETLARRFDYDLSHAVVNHGGTWGYEREAVPKEWFGDGEDLEFEGMSVRCPTKWDAYLTQVYGDYMTPPPEEQRRGYHELTSFRVTSDVCEPGSRAS